MSIKVLVNPLRGTCPPEACRGRAARCAVLVALVLAMAATGSAQAAFFLSAAAGDDLARSVRVAEASGSVSGGGIESPESLPLNTFCLITGPTGGQCGSPMVFTATSPIQPNVPFNATFSILNDTAGASFIGSNS